MKLLLKIWRQKNPNDKGKLKDYQLNNVDPDMSFLEMLDVLNQNLFLREKNLLLLIMTVEREFVGCALLLLMAHHMAPKKAQQLVNCT